MSESRDANPAVGEGVDIPDSFPLEGVTNTAADSRDGPEIAEVDDATLGTETAENHESNTLEYTPFPQVDENDNTPDDAHNEDGSEFDPREDKHTGVTPEQMDDADDEDESVKDYPDGEVRQEVEEAPQENVGLSTTEAQEQPENDLDVSTREGDSIELQVQGDDDTESSDKLHPSLTTVQIAPPGTAVVNHPQASGPQKPGTLWGHPIPMAVNHAAIEASARNKLAIPEVKGHILRLSRPTVSSTQKVRKWYKGDTYVDKDSYSWRNLPLFDDHQRHLWTPEGAVRSSYKK
ncbi:uncharacterized protein LOC131930145 [Physella acuta]|uniref:uncharacterized protein LOC131930145 n=1 Tax=Physella acuta TaxID=109671 RepID=UPI0027DAED1D|nr:uncharacterized protein LOC131930145 [Physella acuta]